MAEERILDARELLAAGRWAYAYYISGYTVECALKSCVLAQMVSTGGVFTDRKFSEKCFTHDFGTLIELAGLTSALKTEFANDSAFVAHWGTVIRWNVESRYDEKIQPEAESLYLAITDTTHGVMRWIRNFW